MSHIWRSVMSHIWMSQVTDVSEWVRSHIYVTWLTHTSDITLSSKTKETCRMAALVSRRSWVRPHTRMSHITRTNASCRTYRSVIPYVRMSHVAPCSCLHGGSSLLQQLSHITHTNESRHTIRNFEWIEKRRSEICRFFWIQLVLKLQTMSAKLVKKQLTVAIPKST